MTELAPRRPPRIVSKADAAAYCRLSEKEFGDLVRAKMLPDPLPHGWGWDIVAIDHAIDRVSGVSRNVPPPQPSALAKFKEERDARKAARAEAEKNGVATRSKSRTR